MSAINAADTRHADRAAAAGRWATLGGRLAALLVLALPSLFGTARAETPPKEESPPAHELTVVLDDNYPPYIFRDHQGELQGYLVDHWKLWEAKTGTRVKLLASDWSLAQQRMRDHEADVIDTLFKNSERQKILDFGAPYAEIPVSIYSHHGIGGIVNAETLRGFLVGAKAGDACIEALSTHGVHSLRTYASYEALVQAAIQGEIRVFCLDEPPANYLLYREHAEQAFRRAFRLYSGQFHRAYQKGDHATLKRVEDGFAAFSPQERQALAEKWMGQSLERMQLPPFFFYTLAGLAGIGALLLLWIALLRRAVRQSTEDLMATLHAIPDPMFEFDSAGHCYRCYAMESSSHPPSPPMDGLPGRTIFETLPPEAAATWFEALGEAGVKGHAAGYQVELDTPGTRRWFELSVARKGTQTGHDARFVVLARDITARLEAEATVRQLAHFDSLTGLPNRATLADRMIYTISRAKRQQTGFALMFLDIDRFKRINDTLGHRAGDHLLILFAQRLRAMLREEDTLSRLGGDEFILILPNTDTEGAAQVAEKIIDSMSAPYLIDAHALACTVSIGIAYYPEDGESFETLSMHADIAMYQAKSAGRNRYVFFQPEISPPNQDIN